MVETFPALHRRMEAAPQAERVLEEGVSSCFYHEQKKAVRACDGCGRFLCALCDMDLNRQHLCPGCLQVSLSGNPSGTPRAGPVPSLETERVLWDSAALFVSVLPMFITPLLGLGFAAWSFRCPLSLVRRSRVRSYLAIVLSLLQLVFWIFVFAGGFEDRPQGPSGGGAR